MLSMHLGITILQHCLVIAWISKGETFLLWSRREFILPVSFLSFHLFSNKIKKKNHPGKNSLWANTHTHSWHQKNDYWLISVIRFLRSLKYFILHFWWSFKTLPLCQPRSYLSLVLEPAGERNCLGTALRQCCSLSHSTLLRRRMAAEPLSRQCPPSQHSSAAAGNRDRSLHDTAGED